jgi:predicted GTPase
VRGKRVLVIEDGPTITHGGMVYGAGYLAAVAAGAIVVDARSAAVSAIRKIFNAYPHIGNVLPAVGYDAEQLAALEATINGAGVDAVVSATPTDLGRLLRLDKPVVRARYAFAETDEPRLSSIVDAFVDKLPGRGGE